MARLHSPVVSNAGPLRDVFEDFREIWDAIPAIASSDPINAKLLTPKGVIGVPDSAMASPAAFKRWAKSAKLSRGVFVLYTEDFSSHHTDSASASDAPYDDTAPDFEDMPDVPGGYPEPGSFEPEEPEDMFEEPKPARKRKPAKRKKPAKRRKAAPVISPEPRAKKGADGRWRYRGKPVTAARARGINARATKVDKRNGLA